MIRSAYTKKKKKKGEFILGVLGINITLQEKDSKILLVGRHILIIEF